MGDALAKLGFARRTAIRCRTLEEAKRIGGLLDRALPNACMGWDSWSDFAEFTFLGCQTCYDVAKAQTGTYDSMVAKRYKIRESEEF